MSDTQSNGESPHDLFRRIDDLCGEVDAGLANQLSEGTVLKLQSWVRRSPSARDECFLAVHEKKGLPEFCMAWLSSYGYTVILARPGEVRGREALMRWRSTLRDLPTPGDHHCVFVRGLNFLTGPEQHEIWAAWVNALPSTSRVRFVYSFVPFAEEFDDVTKYDVCEKVADRTAGWIEHA